MARAPRRLLLATILAAATAGSAGCGETGIQLAENDPDFQGALIFNENCAGCHSLRAAGAIASATDVGSREYKDGPNFNERQESVDDVLYAIRNGGYSSGPMPQNIVTGNEAQMVAEFVAKYAGRAVQRPEVPTQPPPAGAE